jgi:hypothetical protein
VEVTMIINREFIFNVIENFHRSIVNEDDLCSCADASPDNQYYFNEAYQKIYALRYYPAYYFEYADLAEKFLFRLRRSGYKNTNIASFGCGLYPDYFALQHNLTDIEFHYDGYDCCEWETRKLLPNIDTNTSIFNQSVDDIIQDKINTYDAFIFPKSISDINQKEGSIENLACKISNTSKQHIFFMNSYINTSLEAPSAHINIFKPIHDKLLEKGFTTKDNYARTYFSGEYNDGHGQGLSAINPSFEYPIQFISRCLKRTDECRKDCGAVKSPIFKNTYTDYQLLEYTK